MSSDPPSGPVLEGRCQWLCRGLTALGTDVDDHLDRAGSPAVYGRIDADDPARFAAPDALTSVNRAVEMLVRQGFGERLRRQRDMRVVLAPITPTGRRVVDDATADLNSQV